MNPGPLRKFVVALIVLAIVGIVGVRIAYRDLIKGPELHSTPDSLSLTRSLPPAVGWSSEMLEVARVFADDLPSQSVVILSRGTVVAEWGDTSHRIDLHSVRKSLVSALYGIAVDRGMIDLELTLDSLGVEEGNPPLSGLERTARIEDLLTSRSGVYHPSIMDANGPYPEPGTHAPNQTFVYNNWSFNAAGILFEHLVGLTIGEAFQEWIAVPTGMEDFRPGDVNYTPGPESVFAAWRIRMSARDLARFGQLYAQQGRWGGTTSHPRRMDRPDPDSAFGCRRRRGLRVPLVDHAGRFISGDGHRRPEAADLPGRPDRPREPRRHGRRDHPWTLDPMGRHRRQHPDLGTDASGPRRRPFLTATTPALLPWPSVQSGRAGPQAARSLRDLSRKGARR